MEIKANPIEKHFQTLFLAVMIVCIMAGAALWAINRVPFALTIIAAPVTVLLVSYPRAMPYLYAASVTFFWVPIPGTAFFLADFIALMFLASILMDFLLRGKTHMIFPAIGRFYVFLVVALIITGIFAMEPRHAISPIMRAVLQLLVIVLICNTIKVKDVERLILFYFWIMTAHSVFNILAFLNLGGTYRVFGLAYVYYDDLAMLAAPIGLSYFLWSQSWGRSLFYGLAILIVMLGVVSTQSRLPMITIVWVGLAISIASFWVSHRAGVPYVRMRFGLMLLGLGGAILILMARLDIFRHFAERFENLVTDTYTGSVITRISLWNAGIKAFLNNPLTGIGPGNFRFIDLVFPELKFDAARMWVKGYSAHNLVIHYLAETGLIGTVAILSVYFKNLKTSWHVLHNSKADQFQALPWALFGIGLTIAATIFYMDGWMWGLVASAAPFFFALTSKSFYGDTDYE